VMVAASCLLLLFLGIGTWQRSEEFHDSITLWRDTIQKNPDSWLAKYNLATELIRIAREESRQAAASTDPEEAKCLQAAAMADYNESSTLLHDVLRLEPQHEYVHFSLGVIAQLTGHPADAEREFRTEISVEPTYAPTYSNLGMIALSQNRLEEAKQLLERAVVLDSLPPHGRFLPVKSAVTRQALDKVNRILATTKNTE
jgi:Flp pilus assembly protein TadD